MRKLCYHLYKGGRRGRGGGGEGRRGEGRGDEGNRRQGKVGEWVVQINKGKPLHCHSFSLPGLEPAMLGDPNSPPGHSA